MFDVIACDKMRVIVVAAVAVDIAAADVAFDAVAVSALLPAKKLRELKPEKGGSTLRIQGVPSFPLLGAYIGPSVEFIGFRG